MTLRELELKKNQLNKCLYAHNRSIFQFIKDELNYIEMEEIISPFGERNEDQKTVELLNNWKEMYEEMRDDTFHRITILQIEISELEERLEDLKTTITIQLKKNYVKIENKEKKYPEELIWVYKNFFNLDITNREELEYAERKGIFREMMSW